MNFIKMHGLGNDYVYINLFEQAPPRDPAATARAVSDRHRGIGSDGLILVGPSDRADAAMRMFNADGSEAEMCGNGIRCAAKLVRDRNLVSGDRMTMETGRGILTLDFEVRDDRVERVRVDMGQPVLDAASIPTTLPGDPPVDAPLALDDRTTLLVTCISMGNPHAVIYLEPGTDLDAYPVAERGAILERHAAFPRRVNVHFVVVESSEVARMRTWERGSGLTQACGTGACAVCVAGVLAGRTGPRLTAHLPGGPLDLEWSGPDAPVFMTGPAVEVFTGTWPDA